MPLDRRAMIAGLAASVLPMPAFAAPSAGVIELRRCKLLAGERYEEIDRLSRQVRDAQAELGGELLGAFHCMHDYSLDGPMDEFVWMTIYSDISSRNRAFASLSTAPRWQPLRDAADALMLDRGHALLLRQSKAWSVPEQSSRRLYTAMIHDLDGVDPSAFASHFETVLKPRLIEYGIEPFATCLNDVAASQAPGLHRGPALVWFAQWENPAHEALLSNVWPDAGWRDAAPEALLPALRREPEHLLLFPVTNESMR